MAASPRTTRKAPAKKAAAKKTTTRKPAAKKAAAPPAEKRPAPGRPPLLETDPELLSRMVTYVRSGAFPERAAVAVGISERSHYAWQERGRNELERRDAGQEPDPGEDLFVTYVEQLERATAEAEMLLLGSAVKGGATGGAALNILERRFRDRWGAKQPPTAPAPPPTPAGTTTPLDKLAEKRAQREQAAARR